MVESAIHKQAKRNLVQLLKRHQRACIYRHCLACGGIVVCDTISDEDAIRVEYDDTYDTYDVDLDMTTWTAAQKTKFIDDCLQPYLVSNAKITWKKLQNDMRNRFTPKKRFKALQWRKDTKEYALSRYGIRVE